MKTFIPVLKIFDNEDDIFIFFRNVQKSSDSEILFKKKIKYSQWYLGKFCLVFLRFKKKPNYFQLWFLYKSDLRKGSEKQKLKGVEKERNRSKQVEKNSEIKNKLTMEV